MQLVSILLQRIKENYFIIFGKKPKVNNNKL